jgi:hypothetical protein
MHAMVGQPATTTLQDIPWLNFYHTLDSVSGRLEAFSEVSNHRTDAGTQKGSWTSTAQAHSSYWSNTGMYREIRQELAKMLSR